VKEYVKKEFKKKPARVVGGSGGGKLCVRKLLTPEKMTADEPCQETNPRTFCYFGPYGFTDSLVFSDGENDVNDNPY